jgi:hypothetical protein
MSSHTLQTLQEPILLLPWPLLSRLSKPKLFCERGVSHETVIAMPARLPPTIASAPHASRDRGGWGWGVLLARWEGVVCRAAPAGGWWWCASPAARSGRWPTRASARRRVRRLWRTASACVPCTCGCSSTCNGARFSPSRCLDSTAEVSSVATSATSVARRPIAGAAKPYCDQKVANRDIRVWDLVVERKAIE